MNEHTCWFASNVSVAVLNRDVQAPFQQSNPSHTVTLQLLVSVTCYSFMGHKTVDTFPRPYSFLYVRSPCSIPRRLSKSLLLQGYEFLILPIRVLSQLIPQKSQEVLHKGLCEDIRFGVSVTMFLQMLRRVLNLRAFFE